MGESDYLNFQSFLSENKDIEAAFFNAGNTRSYSKDKIIVGQDEADKSIFFLRKGRAKVVVYSEAGNEVHLAELKCGTLFGEMAVLLDSQRSSSVVAQSHCDIVTVSAKDFTALIRNYPELALYMTKMLARRLQDTSKSLFENLVFTVPQRIYENLLLKSVQDEKEAEIYRLSPAPSVTSISETLNVSREAASRAISKLISQGLIKKEKSHWSILKPRFEDY